MGNWYSDHSLPSHVFCGLPKRIYQREMAFFSGKSGKRSRASFSASFVQSYSLGLGLVRDGSKFSKPTSHHYPSGEGSAPCSTACWRHRRKGFVNSTPVHLKAGVVNLTSFCFSKTKVSWAHLVSTVTHSGLGWEYEHLHHHCMTWAFSVRIKRY